MVVDQLSLQAGRVTVFQDVDDTTAFTVEATKDGAPVDLSTSTWTDPDGLMSIDITDAVNGRLGLSCGVQTGNKDWRLQADGDTTWLQGLLVVGSTRRVGAGTGTVSVAVENQTVTVSANVVPVHDHNGAYAPWLAEVNALSAEYAHTNWNIFNFASAYPLTFRRIASGAQNDSVTFVVNLSAGTWSFVLVHQVGPNRGIYTVELSDDDGATWSSVGTVDGYAATEASARDTITGATVSSTGKHLVRLTIATQNASSTGFAGTISFLSFTRTA